MRSLKKYHIIFFQDGRIVAARPANGRPNPGDVFTVKGRKFPVITAFGDNAHGCSVNLGLSPVQTKRQWPKPQLMADWEF